MAYSLTLKLNLEKWYSVLVVISGTNILICSDEAYSKIGQKSITLTHYFKNHIHFLAFQKSYSRKYFRTSTHFRFVLRQTKTRDFYTCLRTGTGSERSWWPPNDGVLLDHPLCSSQHTPISSPLEIRVAKCIKVFNG